MMKLTPQKLRKAQRRRKAPSHNARVYLVIGRQTGKSTQRGGEWRDVM